MEHSARLPVAVPPRDPLHGVSFARATLERFGPFPEDILVGEDTEVTKRLVRNGIEIEWAPEVVTVHRYPTTVRGLIAESWARGRRRGRTLIAERGRRELASVAMDAPEQAARRALQAEGLVSPREVRTVVPLMRASAATKAAAIWLS